MSSNVSIGPATIVGYVLALAGVVWSIVSGDPTYAKWGAAVAAATNAGRQLQAAAGAHGTGAAAVPFATPAEPLPTDAEELASAPPG